MRIKTKILSLMAALTASSALAQEVETVGKPVDRGLGFQPAATELARDLQSLDYMILVIITGIVALVAGLMLYIFVRFNRRANPNPATFTHNTPVEIAWTIGPIIILVFISHEILFD